jgi:hypothetical protein
MKTRECGKTTAATKPLNRKAMLAHTKEIREVYIVEKA